jgi:hypothetical protein
MTSKAAGRAVQAPAPVPKTTIAPIDQDLGVQAEVAKLAELRERLNAAEADAAAAAAQLADGRHWDALAMSNDVGALDAKLAEESAREAGARQKIGVYQRQIAYQKQAVENARQEAAMRRIEDAGPELWERRARIIAVLQTLEREDQELRDFDGRVRSALGGFGGDFPNFCLSPDLYWQLKRCLKYWIPLTEARTIPAKP